MFRLDQEKDNSKFYFWLTLTYSDDHVPKYPSGEMCFSKQHCRDFFEKIRKRYEKHGHTFKHFLVSEYGPEATHRPHYHCLLLVYNDYDSKHNFLYRKEMRDFLIHDCWRYGHVEEKAYHGGVLKYLTKYCCKPELSGEFHTMSPFTLISRGIGLSLLDRIPVAHKKQMIERLDFTYSYNGGKIQLPRYYVDRILPHSLQDLRNSISSGDWETYEKLKDIRYRLQQKQNYKSIRAHADILKIDPFDFDSIRKYEFMKNDTRSYQFAEFRSKLKRRKNL